MAECLTNIHAKKRTMAKSFLSLRRIQKELMTAYQKGGKFKSLRRNKRLPLNTRRNSGLRTAMDAMMEQISHEGEMRFL